MPLDHSISSERKLLENHNLSMLGLAALVFIRTATPWTDPLPSWNHDHPKASIVAFVETAADKRLIAAFDNSDGDLQMLR